MSNRHGDGTLRTLWARPGHLPECYMITDCCVCPQIETAPYKEVNAMMDSERLPTSDEFADLIGEVKEIRVHGTEPSYVQRALDQVRANILELDDNLKSWGLLCVDKKDLLDRVENWRFNTWRHMEETLQEGR